MSNEDQIQQAITRALTFSKTADRCLSTMRTFSMSSGAGNVMLENAQVELQRAVEDMQENIPPGMVVQIVKHYEGLLARAEADSVRESIRIREVVRSILQEERESK